ncbi:MAG TPA: RNA polymerase sigma factor [Usitatibacter sp.]|nr:RNA polymerase sigma factor [Usitatibacter sp.]
MSDSTRQSRFQQLAMPHMDAAYNLARWLAGNTHDAEDITQEAFLRAYRFFDTFRGDDARAWLLKVVRNTFYSQWRQERSRGSSVEFDEDAHSPTGEEAAWAPGQASGNPEAIYARGEEIRRLDEALAGLPVEYREALVLRELEDLPYKEIAATLDVPIGTVMSRLARGRRLLLENFKRTSGDNDELQRSSETVRRIR